jgi:hypothetical protein
VKNVGLDLAKLVDRLKTMLYIGYKDGSKFCHVYDLALKKLSIMRDVVLKGDLPWPWSTDIGIDLQSWFSVVHDMASHIQKEMALQSKATIPLSDAVAKVVPHTPMKCTGVTIKTSCTPMTTRPRYHPRLCMLSLCQHCLPHIL